MPLDQLESALGYRIDQENHASLAATSQAFSTDAMRAFEVPAEIDHRAWLNVEDQGPMGSCVGNSRSSCEEICNYIGTGGAVIQLSRMFAYLTSQKECGLIGQDQGATIDGAAKASAEFGACLEATFPYPNPVRYSTGIPDAALTEGRLHVAKSHSVFTAYQQIFDFLASGVGAVQIGIDWVQSLIQSTGVVDSLSGQSAGGHALCLAGYSQRRDARGRQYIWLVNSHGKRWGNQGWAEISPAVVDHWGQTGQVMIGVSDLESYGPRTIPTFVGMTG